MSLATLVHAPASVDFVSGRAKLPPGARYALLLYRREGKAALPIVWPDLGAMARSLASRRGPGGLQLANAPLMLAGRHEAAHGVSVWSLGLDGQRLAYLGWAWVNGAGRETLEGALRQLEPGPVQ